MKYEYHMIPVSAKKGYVFANKTEDTIYGPVIWVSDDENVARRYSQITKKRAEEIVKAYKDKYHIK